ncbi:MAG: bifunctional folylpolyglutamate synthase/dihydrofolate synthase [Eubacteriales bacterium]|nr:bifunctional folylpolyglutamate synthase/dihydrofolate synthase [Eubacteriales bacterium]
MLTYEEAVDYMEHASLFGSKKNGLENTKALLHRLGDPQAQLRFVHVAGTNGKGSVCAYAESALRAAGYRTGLYTSPYLEEFAERIRVNFRPIAREDFAAVADEVITQAKEMAAEGHDHPTFFELVTACAFLYFSRAHVDIVVTEVGLGGRLDATNVIAPLACAITSIDLEHTKVLGNTVEQIAFEKGGIIKPHIPCALSPALTPHIQEYLTALAQERGAPVLSPGAWHVTPLRDTLDGQTLCVEGPEHYPALHTCQLGAYQRENLLCALMLLHALKEQGFALPGEAVARGIAQMRWPGRMEVYRRSPLILIDGAHNPQGAASLAAAMAHYLPGQKPLLLTGVLSGKDVAGIARQFASFAGEVWITKPESERALPGEVIAEAYAVLGVPTRLFATVEDALRAAMATSRPLIIAGSLYLAGQARTLLRALLSQPPL